MSKRALRASAAAAVGVFVAATGFGTVAAPHADAQSVYYGAIAFAPNGAWGAAWNYPSRPIAEQTATDVCGYTDCKALTSFTECGAVAENDTKFQGGSGRTLIEAQRDALARLGTPGWIAEWACNSTHPVRPPQQPYTPQQPQQPQQPYTPQQPQQPQDPYTPQRPTR